MLVLTRKVGEGIAIGDDIKIVVMQIKGKQVRLGIKASATTIVHREEIYQRIQEENRRAADPATAIPANMGELGSLLKPDADAPSRPGPLRRHVRPAKRGDEED